MKAVCVDHKSETLQQTLALCGEMPQLTETEGFADAEEALSWIGAHKPELALLDLSPETDGIGLAIRAREICPDMAVLFLAEDAQYAIDAWRIHATGYILKPLTWERLLDELNYAAEWKRKQGGHAVISHVSVQTFGNFDLIVDGKKVDFARSKSKELFAYLVDKKGIRVTRPEAFARLWPDEEYTRPKQKQLDVIIRSLRSTLEAYGISEILKLERGTLRIVPQALDCDMYRLFAGDRYCENEYRGEYMTPYTWANQTEGQIDTELGRRRALRSRDIKVFTNQD